MLAESKLKTSLLVANGPCKSKQCENAMRCKMKKGQGHPDINKGVIGPFTNKANFPNISLTMPDPAMDVYECQLSDFFDRTSVVHRWAPCHDYRDLLHRRSKEGQPELRCPCCGLFGKQGGGGIIESKGPNDGARPCVGVQGSSISCIGGTSTINALRTKMGKIIALALWTTTSC